MSIHAYTMTIHVYSMTIKSSRDRCGILSVTLSRHYLDKSQSRDYRDKSVSRNSLDYLDVSLHMDMIIQYPDFLSQMNMTIQISRERCCILSVTLSTRFT